MYAIRVNLFREMANNPLCMLHMVPFILVNADPSYKLREGGCLADIAPTLIELMGMEQPKEMTGKSLLVK